MSHIAAVQWPRLESTAGSAFGPVGPALCPVIRAGKSQHLRVHAFPLALTVMTKTRGPQKPPGDTGPCHHSLGKPRGCCRKAGDYKDCTQNLWEHSHALAYGF